MSNYIIVLFKNKTKKKIIKKFQTHKNAKKYYDSLLEDSDSVIFSMETENGKPCVYEIGFLEKDINPLPYYIKDDFGRQIKVELEDPNYSLTKLTKYKKEELIYDVSKSKRITVQYLMKHYLPKSGIKLVSKINNKIVIQNDSEINLFSLKTEGDSNRLMDSLSNYFLSKGRIDCILVKDSSKEQKKYLYGLLNDAGYDKSVLYRRFTTYKRY